MATIDLTSLADRRLQEVLAPFLPAGMIVGALAITHPEKTLRIIDVSAVNVYVKLALAGLASYAVGLFVFAFVVVVQILISGVATWLWYRKHMKPSPFSPSDDHLWRSVAALWLHKTLVPTNSIPGSSVNLAIEEKKRQGIPITAADVKAQSDCSASDFQWQRIYSALNRYFNLTGQVDPTFFSSIAMLNATVLGLLVFCLIAARDNVLLLSFAVLMNTFVPLLGALNTWSVQFGMKTSDLQISFMLRDLKQAAGTAIAASAGKQ